MLELLMAVAVMGLLVAMAVPPMEAALSDIRLRAVAAEFADSLSSARTEAARRNMPVLMCPRKAGSSVCDTAAADWNQGWVLFSNADASGRMGADDVLISLRGALPIGYRVGSSAGQAEFIAVLPSGEHRFKSGSARSIGFSKGAARRHVVVSRVGRAAVLDDSQCTPSLMCSR